jgi:hypothetical protein
MNNIKENSQNESEANSANHVESINKSLDQENLKINYQNERIDNLLKYLNLYIKKYPSEINTNTNTFSLNKNLDEKHFNTFKLNNSDLHKFLIKKKWSLYQDFHFLLCKYSFYNEIKKNKFFELFKEIKNFIKTQNIEFNNVAECGIFIYENFVDKNTKNYKLIMLRLISYLYYYKYELFLIKKSDNEIIKNNYFKIYSRSINKYERNYILKTNILYINEEINIWKSIENKNIIMIFRGTLTKNIEYRDIKSNLSIILGKYGDINNLNYGDRLQYSIELYIYLSKLYYNYSISLGGYSLGGTNVYYINKFICLKNIELKNREQNLEIKKPYIVYSLNQGRLFIFENNFKYLKISDYKNYNLWNDNIILILTKGFDPISLLNKRSFIKIKKIIIKKPSKQELMKKSIWKTKIFHSIKFLDDSRFSIFNLSENIITNKNYNYTDKIITQNNYELIYKYIKNILKADYEPLTFLGIK